MPADNVRGITPREASYDHRIVPASERPAPGVQAMDNVSREGGKHAAQPARPRTRKATREEQQRMYARRRLGAVLILLLTVVLFIRACVPSEHDREMKAWQEQAPQVQQAQEQAVGTEDIPPARPVEMVVPAVDLKAGFEKEDCRFVDGAIDPESLSEACAFTDESKPYQLPGTNSSDIVVIAGHAAAGVPAVFDKLYNPSEESHTVKVGDSLYIKTQESGDRWLKYTATDLHEPEKSGLSDDKSIWGEDPTPGRLLLITCIQPANPFKESVQNAVIGFQFAGVAGDEEVQAG